MKTIRFKNGFEFQALIFRDPFLAASYCRSLKSPRCAVLGDEGQVWIVRCGTADKLLAMGYEEAR